MPRELWNSDDVSPIQYNSVGRRFKRFVIRLVVIVLIVAAAMVGLAVYLAS